MTRPARHVRRTPEVQPLEIGDLPARWQLAAVATFFTLVGVVVGVPDLLGHPWLWDHAWALQLVAPAYWSATAPWWQRRSGVDHGYGAVPLEVAAVRARTRVRWRARRALVRWWTAALLAAVTAVAVPVVLCSDGAHDRELVRTQPHQALLVEQVTPVDDGEPGVLLEASKDLYATEAWLYRVSSLPVAPQVGQRVEVVVDPADHWVAVPVGYRGSIWNRAWTAVPLGLAAAAGVLFLGWRGGWQPVWPSRVAARAALRAGSVQAVRVLDASDGVTVVTQDGARLRWRLLSTGTDGAGRVPVPGTVLLVLGDLRAGGHAAAVHRHWVLWTAAPLDELDVRAIPRRRPGRAEAPTTQGAS